MNPRSLLTLAVSAVLVIAGVLIEGAQENPWNLAASYFFAVGAIDVLRRLPAVAAWVVSTVLVGLAIYGAAWTLGPDHAASAWASLVYVGLVGAVLSSAMMPIRGTKTQRQSGA